MTSAFWTMTDFDGKGYINNPHGDTILQTVDYDTAIEICRELNSNLCLIKLYQPELKAIIKRIPNTNRKAG